MTIETQGLAGGLAENLRHHEQRARAKQRDSVGPVAIERLQHAG
jgi:hypothetical protein